MIRKLTKAEIPDGSVLGVMHDVHIPHHDASAVKLALECMEDAGVTHAVLDGDIADCGVSSRHPGKRARDQIDLGTLPASVEPGRWIYEWARTRPCWLLRGNHEKWVEEMIKCDPSLAAVSVENLLGLPEDGDGWEVLDSESALRFGSLVIEHGHGIFPSGAGGQNPGARIKTVAPNQITLIGHLHRKFATHWTVHNDDGVPKTYAAYGGGHLSIESSHHGYAGRYPGWQQSFEIIRVWYDGERPRFTIDQIEIHRNRNNRPIFEYGNKVYR